MDYKKKYEKYKNKYLQLKTQIYGQLGGSEEFIEELKKLYPECVHDSGTISKATEYEQNNYATTYGEMNYEAIEKYNQTVNLDNKYKYFIDFGSGRGKLPLYMGTKVKKSIGIELVKERHEDAVKLLNKLSVEYPQITQKVELICGDMFVYLENINKTTFDDSVMIWVSNLCFGEDLTEKLFNQIVKKFPSGTVIASSKIPKDIPNGMIQFIVKPSNKNELVVPMSWSSNSTIYLYMVV